MLLTVRNRYAQTAFEGMYDGISYKVVTDLTLPDHIARHLKKRSLIRDNPVTGEQEFRLAIVEEGDEDTPLEMLPRESLDRTDMDYRRVTYIETNTRPVPPPSKADRVVSSVKER